MSDDFPDVKVIAVEIAKRLPPGCDPIIHRGIIQRIEGQLEYYLSPFRNRCRAQAFREAGNECVKSAANKVHSINTVHTKLYAMAAEEEAKAKGDGA